jgi:hypothetical protein
VRWSLVQAGFLVGKGTGVKVERQVKAEKLWGYYRIRGIRHHAVRLLDIGMTASSPSNGADVAK